jgi:hypothetical protein
MPRRKSATTASISEASLQTAIVARWRLLGTPGSLIAHIPNGGSRDAITGARLKSQGVLAGMPDLVCSSPSGGVFWIELKRRGGRPTPVQLDVHARLRSAGGCVYVLDDLDAAIALLTARGVLRPTL